MFGCAVASSIRRITQILPEGLGYKASAALKNWLAVILLQRHANWEKESMSTSSKSEIG
jgi:hypothetical protein